MSPFIYKQLSERHSPFEIDKFLWNSKFDLLALSSIKGDVCLQRIFWKKAWDFSNPFPNVTVDGLCWSPKGECLCVRYSNGYLHFLEIETGKSVYNLTF